MTFMQIAAILDILKYNNSYSVLIGEWEILNGW